MLGVKNGERRDKGWPLQTFGKKINFTNGPHAWKVKKRGSLQIRGGPTRRGPTEKRIRAADEKTQNKKRSGGDKKIFTE